MDTEIAWGYAGELQFISVSGFKGNTTVYTPIAVAELKLIP